MHTYIIMSYFAKVFYWGVCLGFLSGRFCPGWFLSVQLLSEYIHYNGKLNITCNFRFHMYEILLKCDVTCSWTPSPVTNCHTFSDPSLERDVLYGRPLKSKNISCSYCSDSSVFFITMNTFAITFRWMFLWIKNRLRHIRPRLLNRPVITAVYLVPLFQKIFK